MISAAQIALGSEQNAQKIPWIPCFGGETHRPWWLDARVRRDRRSDPPFPQVGILICTMKCPRNSVNSVLPWWNPPPLVTRCACSSRPPLRPSISPS